MKTPQHDCYGNLARNKTNICSDITQMKWLRALSRLNTNRLLVTIRHALQAVLIWACASSDSEWTASSPLKLYLLYSCRKGCSVLLMSREANPPEADANAYQAASECASLVEADGISCGSLLQHLWEH